MSGRSPARRAAVRAAARRHLIRQRRMVAASAMALVLAVVTGLVVARIAIGPAQAAVPAPPPVGPVDLGPAMAAVPLSILDKIGRGTPTGLPRAVSGLPAQRQGGKPIVLYVGAEYCPYCAAQRWPLAIALARFGVFHGLRPARSATDDVYPGTATLSFHGATYASDYLAFDGVETQTSTYAALDHITAAQQHLADVYANGGIPFLVLGDRYVQTGASYDPGLLAGLSTQDIIGALSNPDSRVAQAVLGAANGLTAALCQLTGGQPAGVCTSPGVTVYTGQFSGH
jgi:thiol-disulfide isomerase/thioredoxin